MTTDNGNQRGNSPRSPSPRLSFDDAVRIWKLRHDGWFQNRIAALFDVNPGRVNEVLKGRRHPGSERVALGA